MTVSRTFLRRLERRVKALEKRFDPQSNPLNKIVVAFIDHDHTVVGYRVPDTTTNGWRKVTPEQLAEMNKTEA